MGYKGNPTKTMRRIRCALTRFENAARGHAFKGSTHPDDWDYIDAEYAQAREMVERVIREELEEK